MKKILLIITLCLFSLNGYTKDQVIPIENVDIFFTSCKDAEDKDDFQIAAYCYGYIRASMYYIYEHRKSKKLVNSHCNPTVREMKDRFRILYQRNQFEIGSSVDDALYWTHVSLCPTTDQEDKSKETPKFQD